MARIRFILYSFLSLLLCGCSPSNITNADKVRLILDTDLGPDYDDVGAMAVMHALADSGYVDILATVSSNKSELTIPCIDIINTYFKRCLLYTSFHGFTIQLETILCAKCNIAYTY